MDGHYKLTIEYSEPNPDYKVPTQVADIWHREMNVPERLSYQALSTTLSPQQFEQVKLAILSAWGPRMVINLDTKDRP